MPATDSSRVPVIDVNPLVVGEEGRHQVAAQIREACETSGFFYVVGHGVDEALQQMKLAEECDPFSLIIGTNVGTVLYCRRQYDEALTQFRKVAEMGARAGRQTRPGPVRTGANGWPDARHPPSGRPLRVTGRSECP